MAMPSFPPAFGAPSGPNMARPSEADIDQGARFLSHYLEGTRPIVALSPDPLPTPTPQECQTLSPGESVLIPLLCSTIHALNSIGHRVDKLHTLACTTWALQLQIPLSAQRSGTSLTKFLTCHLVWHLPSFDVHLPLPSPPHSPTLPQAGLTDPVPPPLWQSPETPPPQPAVTPPTRSYADVIHGSTGKFHQAIAVNAAVCRGKGKGKKCPSATTGYKVTSGVDVASPNGPPPLTRVTRRVYAPRNMPAPHPERHLIRIRWPDLAPPSGGKLTLTSLSASKCLLTTRVRSP